MKVVKVGKLACAVSVALCCVVGLAACSGDDPKSAKPKVEGLTGGVAATVNGVEIDEDTITSDIELYRASSDLTGQDAWGQWLVDYDYTPESIREEMLDSYISQELIKQAAKDNNIEIPSSEIDEYLGKTKSHYDTDTAWEKALETAGITEGEYRESIEKALIEKKVQEAVIKTDEISDEELLEAAQVYASYYDGAKQSSHILFDAGDEATAQEVLDKINSGELDFVEAVKKYSKDVGTAEQDGKVGWDKMSSLVPEYTEALDTLEVDQVSGLVKSEYGIHIIKCTEVFHAPETLTSLDQIPADFLEGIKTNLENSKKNEAYSTWLEDYRKNADIVINDMPENVPYNVDVSQYTPSEDSAGAMAGTGASTGETGGAEEVVPDQPEEAGQPVEGSSGDQAA